MSLLSDDDPGPFRSRGDLAKAVNRAYNAFGGEKITRTLGAGGNGIAYETSFGNVMKFTTSAIEALTVNFLRHCMSLDPLGLEGLAEIKTKAYVAYGDGNTQDSIFVYTVEKLEPVTVEQAKALPTYVDKESRDDRASNAFWHAYRAVHAECMEKDKKAKAKYHKRYIRNLLLTADYEGYERAADAVITLATSNQFGGPFLVGDFKPVNCGMSKEGFNKAFDLYVYNAPRTPQFMPEIL